MAQVQFYPEIDTEQRVLKWLGIANDELDAGKTVSSWTGPSGGGAEYYVAHPLEVRDAAVAFLKQVNPLKYGFTDKCGKVA